MHNSFTFKSGCIRNCTVLINLVANSDFPDPDVPTIKSLSGFSNNSSKWTLLYVFDGVMMITVFKNECDHYLFVNCYVFLTFAIKTFFIVS